MTLPNSMEVEEFIMTLISHHSDLTSSNNLDGSNNSRASRTDNLKPLEKCGKSTFKKRHNGKNLFTPPFAFPFNT